jgi:hypothetical protein
MIRTAARAAAPPATGHADPPSQQQRAVAPIARPRRTTSAPTIVRRGAAVALTLLVAGGLSGLSGAAAAAEPIAVGATSATVATQVLPESPALSGPANLLDKRLLSRINYARAHPEEFAPNGNSSGAKMTPCTTPLKWSNALASAARRHNEYIGVQSKEWLQGKTPDGNSNAHLNSDGKLSWVDGGSIAQAGYNSKRAEIVAFGQDHASQAVKDWMQNDAGSNWGHRNIILDCELTRAGADQYSAGPWGHYYTMDAGKR